MVTLRASFCNVSLEPTLRGHVESQEVKLPAQNPPAVTRQLIVHVLLTFLLSSAAFCQAALDSRLSVLDSIIDDAIVQQQIPGAVVIIGHDGLVVYRKAYGSRAIEPKREAMTIDTVFDCASLTKVVATTTAILQLWEQGKFRMNDPVAKYVPSSGRTENRTSQSASCWFTTPGWLRIWI